MTREYLPEIEDDCERDHEGVARLNVLLKMFRAGIVNFMREQPGMIYWYYEWTTRDGKREMHEDYFATEDLDEMHAFVMRRITLVQERLAAEEEVRAKA